VKVLVDTCVWSQVLRYKLPNVELSKKFGALIKNNKVVIIGPIRQELLSGISNKNYFKKLKKFLFPFKDISLKTEHFEKAAEFSNICRRKGIQGSTVDCLICAVAYIENFTIFTIDKDFENYKKILPIKILSTNLD